MKRIIWLTVIAVTFTLGAQEKSVRPGVNQQFENPSAEEFVGRFERDGRDAYDHRDAVVKAIGLKPGMTVADIGAGTGLFTRLFAKEVGPEGRVYAVDIARNFVDHIQKQADAAGQKNIRGVVCLPAGLSVLGVAGVGQA